MQDKNTKDAAAKPRYKWPWFVLAAVLLGAALALVWMSGEIERTRRIRDLNSPTQQGGRNDTASTAALAAGDTSWTNDMVWLPGGTFFMGSEDGQPDEKPVHQVALDGFWIDKTEVTNEQFDRFVRATGYVTVAEHKPDPKDFPDAPAEMLVPGSLVFTPPSLDQLNPERAQQGLEHWTEIPAE